MTLQVVAALTNQLSLCIGEITTKEAEMATADNPAFDGNGLYLVSVDSRNPLLPGAVLAKFASEEAALALARFFRLAGNLECA
jgi:hypothetical protein